MQASLGARSGARRHRAVATTLLVVATVLASLAGPVRTAANATLTFVPIADASVSSAASTTNYASAALRVDGSPDVRSYVKFDASSLTGTVQSATLRIWATSAQSVGFDVYAVGDSSWTETGLTYANQPSGSISPTKLGSSGSVTAGTWKAVDVTALVTAPGDYSVVLETTNSRALALASREDAAQAPQLVVTASAGPTVPGAPANVSATAGNAQATVSWTAAAANGSPISGYTIRGSPGGSATAAGSATSAIVTGLTNGTSYRFTVTATNGVGTGPASSPSNAVVPSAGPSVVPPGFEDTKIAQVNVPVGIAFTPDGRLLLLSQFGRLHVYKNGALLPSPALDISAKLCSDKDRGLLGVAVDPAFSSNQYVFLYYTFKRFGVCDYDTANSPVNRVSRFVMPDSNVVDPASEVVLIDNIPQPDIHPAGDLHFGKDGFLYISVGDGGCDYAGNSGCGGQNDASRDQNVLLGKILRIDRNGGIPATNPFLGTDSARCNVAGRTDAGKKCQETYAWGLRNPWRTAFDPNAAGTTFFVNDVGQAIWEEIDLGQAGADYGWNVREGHCARNSSTDCGPPPAGMTNPIYDYSHNTGCTSITGGAFVPNGVWPAAFDNTYLYGDFTCGKIIRLTPIQGGGFTAADFITGLGTNSITTMSFGPDGTTQSLYYMSYLGGGEVHRVRLIGASNRAPTAVATADRTSGAVPLTVDFDGTGSSDPDGDVLIYDWNFGDGTAPSSSAAPTHVYNSAGTFTATLTVSDGRGGQGSDSLRIDAGNTPPTATIESPSTSKRFRMGEIITLRGSATDPQDGQLPNSALTWTVIKHHDTHAHPFLPATSGNDIPITMPDPEDLAATTTTYLEIQLTATDSAGLSSTVTQNLLPNVVNITFQTQLPGLRVDVNGTTFTGPSTLVSWEAYVLNVNAPDQIDSSGRPWRFSSWSDGGAAAHAIVTPAAAVTYAATFAPATTVFADDFELGNLSRWTSVTGVVAQGQIVHSDAWAARATNTGAGTFAYKQLTVTYGELYYGQRFFVVSQRANDLTLGTFRTSTGAPILAFYRSASRTLCLRNYITSSALCSATRPSIGAWHQLEVRLRVGAPGSTEVWLDGVRIDALSQAQSLGTTAIGRIQVGDNQTGRTYDVVFDDVAVGTGPI